MLAAIRDELPVSGSILQGPWSKGTRLLLLGRITARRRNSIERVMDGENNAITVQLFVMECNQNFGTLQAKFKGAQGFQGCRSMGLALNFPIPK